MFSLPLTVGALSLVEERTMTHAAGLCVARSPRRRQSP
jgi:hypothetical protein